MLSSLSSPSKMVVSARIETTTASAPGFSSAALAAAGSRTPPSSKRGVITMKMMSRTIMMSAIGVTLMSLIARPTPHDLLIAMPSLLVLVQTELDGDGEDDADGLAVQRRRCVDPAADGVHRGARQERWAAHDLDVRDPAVRIDHALEHDLAFDVRAPRELGVDRHRSADPARLADVAPRSHRCRTVAGPS